MYPKAQLPKGTSSQVIIYPSSYVPKRPSAQVPKYLSTQVPRFPTAQVHDYPSTQILKYPNFQVPMNPSIQDPKFLCTTGPRKVFEKSYIDTYCCRLHQYEIPNALSTHIKYKIYYLHKEKIISNYLNMCHFVVIQIARSSEPLATNSALMRFLAAMNASVGIQR